MLLALCDCNQTGTNSISPSSISAATNASEMKTNTNPISGGLKGVATNGMHETTTNASKVILP